MTLQNGSVKDAESFHHVRAEIEKALVEREIPSISVAVAQHGKIIWEEGFGWADRENRVPANEHTMYSLASISKPITTTGLMTLVQAGKIDLDSPVNEYLGDAKVNARLGNADDATVRQVANHTSGLPLHYQFFYEDEPYRRPSMDETILRYGNLLTPPGENFQYSNLAYGVLDYIISRVSGMSFTDYMRREVFLKLGLTHMTIDIGPGLEQHHAIRYDAGGKPIPFYEFDHPGASAVYSSAHDLVRFGMFHLKNHLADQSAILTDAMLDEMQRVTTSGANVHTMNYGVGWSNREQSGYRVVSHGGGMPGVGTILDFIPSENIAVAVLMNRSDQFPNSTVPYIRDLIVKTLLPKWESGPGFQPPVLPPTQPLPELTGSWEGTVHTYLTDLPVKLECLPDGNVHVRLGDQLTALLNGVELKDGWLTGATLGDLGTPDVHRGRKHHLSLWLKLHGNELTGGTVALSGDTYALAHWTKLRKT